MLGRRRARAAGAAMAAVGHLRCTPLPAAIRAACPPAAPPSRLCQARPRVPQPRPGPRPTRPARPGARAPAQRRRRRAWLSVTRRAGSTPAHSLVTARPPPRRCCLRGRGRLPAPPWLRQLAGLGHTSRASLAMFQFNFGAQLGGQASEAPPPEPAAPAADAPAPAAEAAPAEEVVASEVRRLHAAAVGADVSWPLRPGLVLPHRPAVDKSPALVLPLTLPAHSQPAACLFLPTAGRAHGRAGDGCCVA